jgi:hypothetical protein
MTRSKLCENEPEKVEKIHCCTLYPGRNAQKYKKKLDPPGVLYAGSSGRLINIFKLDLKKIKIVRVYWL